MSGVGDGDSWEGGRHLTLGNRPMTFGNNPIPKNRATWVNKRKHAEVGNARVGVDLQRLKDERGWKGGGLPRYT